MLQDHNDKSKVQLRILFSQLPSYISGDAGSKSVEVVGLNHMFKSLISRCIQKSLVCFFQQVTLLQPNNTLGLHRIIPMRTS